MIPEDFAQRMIELYADQGRAWLAKLPALLNECAKRWALTIGPPVVPLSYNYVAPAMRSDGTQLILKLGVPNPARVNELVMLRWCAGNGIVAVLDADAELGILLLERLIPGTMLSDYVPDQDAQATRIAAQVMRSLWRPAPAQHSFPSVADWAAGLSKLRPHFGGTTGPFPPALVEEAETLFAELLASPGEPVLLHGDLHHMNILTATRQPWLAIDPQGVIGEREYEVGALLRNPMPQLLNVPNPGRMLARRIAILADELGFDPERLRAWGIAHAVLSAWWDVEDHGQADQAALACAQLLREMRI